MGFPDRYQIVVYGRDYSAYIKNHTASCGWYIHYLKNPA